MLSPFILLNIGATEQIVCAFMLKYSDSWPEGNSECETPPVDTPAIEF